MDKVLTLVELVKDADELGKLDEDVIVLGKPDGNALDVWEELNELGLAKAGVVVAGVKSFPESVADTMASCTASIAAVLLSLVGQSKVNITDVPRDSLSNVWLNTIQPLVAFTPPLVKITENSSVPAEN